VDLDIDIEGWPEDEWQALADRVAAVTCQVAPELTNPRLSVSLLLTNDAEVHALNRQWRDRDKPTNVLSFPMLARDELLALESEGPPALLGDLALGHETCAREAQEKEIPLQHHAAHLMIHGFLHLAGYDHVDSDEKAEAMEALEIAGLAKLGIPDPYEDRN